MSSDQPVAQTPLGAYRGVRLDSGVDVWRGIPYATPPVGDLRWRRARPIAPHDGVLVADRFGAVCPQEVMPVIGLGPDPTFSEDCLYLNVWTPPEAAGHRPLPVMVWLHGGAYVFGCGSQPLYDATHLVADGAVIVVTINYRLGAFGFADFSGIDPERFETNPALSDVLAALGWVRDNIADFGGDPDSVTVFGESAGGGLVTTLLTMPAADGLFHRAIAQSSPATAVYESSRAQSVAQRIVDALRGPAAGGAATGTDVEVLLGAGADELVTATMAVFADVPVDRPGIIAFAPVVDGDLVPVHPVDAFQAGKSLRVPLMIGTNKDEAALFRWMKSPLMPIAPADLERMFADLGDDHPELTLPDRAQIVSAYSGMRPKVAGLGVSRDVAFRMPTLWVAEAHGAHSPVFLYRFDWATRMLRTLRIGATHATELPYVWGNLTSGSKDITFMLGGRKTGEQISRRLVARWTGFGRSGDPTPDGVEPAWPAFTAERRCSLVIDATDRVVDDLDADLRATWGDQPLGFR